MRHRISDSLMRAINRLSGGGIVGPVKNIMQKRQESTL